MSWWKMNLGTWFWPKSQSLTSQYANDHFALVNDLLENVCSSRLGNGWKKTWGSRVMLLRNERANFGVQQLPLLNLLIPEELDWRVCHSWLEGERWLNTRVPRNLHSKVNGLIDAIWRSVGKCWKKYQHKSSCWFILKLDVLAISSGAILIWLYPEKPSMK